MTSAPQSSVPLILGAQIDARAEHPEIADRQAIRHGDRIWTWRQFRDESVRVAHFLRARLEPTGSSKPGHVAMLMENHPELLSLYAGCGYAGYTLFGVNTGLRGDALAGVINESLSRLLVVDERLFPEVEKLQDRLEHVAAENILVVATAGTNDLGARELARPDMLRRHQG